MSKENNNGPETANKAKKRPPRRNFRKKNPNPKNKESEVIETGKKPATETKGRPTNSKQNKPITTAKKPTERNQPNKKKPDSTQTIEQKPDVAQPIKKKLDSTQPVKKNNRRRRNRNPRKDTNEGFKLVARHLPPNLSESEFMDVLKPVIQDRKLAAFGIINYYYHNGSIETNLFEKPVYSRAYFTFDTMDNLRKFGNSIKDLTFVDNKDNVTKAVLKVSPYVKKLEDPNVSRRNRSKKIEGKIEKNPIFKQFLKTIELMESKDDSPYAFNNISIFRPLAKQLAKEKKINDMIEKKSELAMIKLSGVDKSKEKDDKEKKKKKKKKKKRDRKKKDENKTKDDPESQSKKKEKTSKRKRKAKASKKEKESNNNVIILEEAGKREMRNRKKILELKERENSIQETRNEMMAKVKERRMLLRKAKEAEQVSKKDNTAGKVPVTILKREDKQ